MGTNYYARKNLCECCGRYDELHIGKSSVGWCFALHVIPKRGLNTLENWRDWLMEKSVPIFDEYGTPVSIPQLMDIITNRSWATQNEDHQSWFAVNQAVPGPNGLARSAVDEAHCIGHGEGTWDYIISKFS